MIKNTLRKQRGTRVRLIKQILYKTSQLYIISAIFNCMQSANRCKYSRHTAFVCAYMLQ